MTFSLCGLWPLLAGGLIAWLLAGWFARHLKYTAPPIEHTIEAVKDNPKHLALISKLETENKKIPDLVAKIAHLETSSPKIAEKTVEKVVDNPEHLARIKKLEAENSEIPSLRTRLKSFENQTAQAIETNTNNPKNISNVNNLAGEITNSQQAPAIDLKQNNNQDDFTLIDGIDLKINALIHNDGIQTFADLANTQVDAIQKILDNAGSSYKHVKPGTWPAQSDMAASNEWDSLKAWQDKLNGGK